MGKISKAVIPAAGAGSRFYPLTRAQPKEMLPVVDKPVIHYVVEEAVRSGLDEILIIAGAGKDAIMNYFDHHFLDDRMEDKYFMNLPDIFFVRQKGQLGLADAVRCSKSFVGDDPFVVLLGDTIYESGTGEPATRQIIRRYEELGNPVIAVENVPKSKTKDYGMVDGVQVSEGLWLVKNLVEKPSPEEAPSDLGITGIYALEPDIFGCIDNLKPGRNGELQLTDALLDYSGNRKVYASTFKGTRYDIGTKELWIKTFIEFTIRDERFRNILKDIP